MPDESLSRYQQFEVQRMIDTSMKEAAIIQESRHRENSQKLDRNARETRDLKDSMDAKIDELRDTLSEASGVRKLVAWGLPTLVAALSLAAEILRSHK